MSRSVPLVVESLHVELIDLMGVVYGVGNLDGITTDFAVLNVSLSP